MLFLLLISTSLVAAPPVARAEGLSQTALSPLLDRRFSNSGVSFLLLHTDNGEILAERWDRPRRAVPLGSLVKPFTALAYGTKNAFRYPTLACGGKRDGCWYLSGHGPVALAAAIANSCNAYFRELSAVISYEDLSAISRRFHLPAPPVSAPRSAYIGIGNHWVATPLEMARAYGRMAQQSSGPGISEIVRGLAMSARQGTAQGVGRALDEASALAKTGTAPCVHPRRADGDGYALVLYPGDQPRYTLLVQVHGQTGRRAADIAGRMLRTVIAGE